MISHTLNIFDTIIEVREYDSDKKPALLAIHGWGNTLERADAFIEGLAKNYHLYTLILPGYGKSLPNVQSQKIEYLASLIDPICKKLKIQPHLLGYSLGCLVISTYLSQNPSYNQKVILIGPPLVRTHKPFLVRLAGKPLIRGVIRKSQFMRSIIIQQTKIAMKQISVQKKRKLWMTPVHEATTEGLFDTILAAMCAFPDPRLLPQMIAYIYGKDDLLIPLTDVPKNLTIIPGAGHLIVFEQPVVLAQTVRKILSEPLWPCAPEK